MRFCILFLKHVPDTLVGYLIDFLNACNEIVGETIKHDGWMTHFSKRSGYLVKFFLYLLVSFVLRCFTSGYFRLEIFDTVDGRLYVTGKAARGTNLLLNFLDG